jgi:hypothetical protein
MSGPPRRLGKVIRKSNGYTLVEVLDGGSTSADPIGYCVLGPDPRVDNTWLLDLPTAEIAFDVRIRAELSRPRRKPPIVRRRRPRE